MGKKKDAVAAASKDRKGEESQKTHLMIVALIFFGALGLIVAIFMNFPSLPPEHKDRLRVPRDLESAKEIGKILSQYTDSHYFTVMAAVCTTYVFLQAFSIPGTIFLNFLSGALFGLYVGFAMSLINATIGASLSFTISYFIGRGIVSKLFPHRLAWFGDQINKHKKHLFNYLLFLRLTPLLPNWFINISSPVLGVPYSYFCLATFFGIMPASFIAVKAGLTLQEIKSPSDAFNMNVILTMFGLGLITMLPTWKPFQNALDKLFNR